MSNNEISTTNFTLDEKLQKNLLLVAVIACCIHALWLLINFIVNITNNYSQGFGTATRIISNLLTVLAVVGFFVAIYLMNKENQIKIVLYIAFAIYALIYFVNVFTSLYSEVWARFVLRILLAIPVILLYSFYWKEDFMAQVLLIATSLRLVLRLVLTGLSLSTIDTLGLAIGVDLLAVVLLALLGLWFYQIMNKKASGLVEKETKKPVSATTSSSLTTATTISGESGYSFYTKSQGLNRTVPTLLFWCETCNKQITNIRLKSMKPEDIETEHICPECNSVVKAFWLEPDQGRYIKFLIGLSLFGGAIIVMAINAGFGWLGWAPYMFGVIFAVAGLAINWKMLTRNYGLEGPPPHATTIPSAEPSKEFPKELIITSIIALIGGGIVFGIIVGLSSLF